MATSYTAQSSIASSLSRGFAGMISRHSPTHISHGLHTSKQLNTLTPVAANGATYTVVVNGNSASYTADGSATVAEITAGLTNAINSSAMAASVTAVDGTTALTIESDFAGEPLNIVASSTAGSISSVVTTANGALLPDGVLVVRDASINADPMAVRVPTSAGDITGGVAVAGVTIAENVASVRTAAGAAAPCMVNIMRKGFVLVQVEENVTANSAVYVRYAAGGNGRGSFGAGAGSSERALLAGAVYRSAASAGGLAEVEVNLPA